MIGTVYAITIDHVNQVFALLIADDEPDYVSSLTRMLRKKPYRIYTAGDGEVALELFKENHVDAAVIDLKMPKMDGLSLLRQIKEVSPHTTVLILTGHGGVSEAVKAIKLGATNFQEKPVTADQFLAHINSMEELWRLSGENDRLQDLIDFTLGFDSLIGNSPPMIFMKRMITQAGPTDSTVLIQGETGTGKELVAKALHKHSGRAGGPFVPVDSASISESVIESELFGHMKGAFTGAQGNATGLIRSAEKGTIFFDEIGELPLHVQAKLLRTLQEREVRPVGSPSARKVDVRIIAATNRDLRREIERRTFREDLFYRLSVITLEVPPLRKRESDIPLLVRHFLKQFSSGDRVFEIDSEALRALTAPEWPGNVRELENAVRRAVAFAKTNTISAEDFGLPEVGTIESRAGNWNPISNIRYFPESDSMAAYEKTAIANALEKTGGNRKAAAELLDIGEATLYRKIKTYHI